MIKAVNPPAATGELKTPRKSGGRHSTRASWLGTPKAMPRLMARTITSLLPKYWRAIIRIPAPAMRPNKTKVTPPSTGFGIIATSCCSAARPGAIRASCGYKSSL